MNVEAAIELARSGRLYPAVILHGADDGQRRRLAIEIARTLLCAESPERRPCNRCRHCRRIDWPRDDDTVFHPDFAVLCRDLRTVTSVGATKELVRASQVTPFEARGQVFVIASAETLSGEAANALLKTLEEPPSSAPRHFLLLAPSQLDLLPTLRSRSLALFLGTTPRPAGDDLQTWADGFGKAVDSYRCTGNAAELLAAAAELKRVGSWKDPRASEPWERAATVVVEAAMHAPRLRSLRRRLLELAADLLDGPRLHVRGVSADRLLEGLISRHLGS